MLNLSTLLSRWTNGEEVSAVDEHVETATNIPPHVATAVIQDLKKVEINGLNALMTNDNPNNVMIFVHCLPSLESSSVPGKMSYLMNQLQYDDSIKTYY